jgi:hypothetical protein
MKLEYRVFHETKLIFRKIYRVPLFDRDVLQDFATLVIKDFLEVHPSLRLGDPSVRTDWCKPEEPLPH